MNAATNRTSISAPARPPSARTTAAAYAGRTVKQFIRTPQLIVVTSLTSIMFLLIFRYVFGGALQTGSISYVDFLIPASAVIVGLFSTGAVGVAEDAESGLFDRLRSLPVPRSAVLMGRSLADTALISWAAIITIIAGFAVGFRIHGSALGALAALGLVVLFAAVFSWVQIALGLFSDSPQTAQGIAFLVFPLVFISSAYVPIESMPGWMQPIAENQPVTAMVGAVRALVLGGDTEQLLGHSTSWFVVRSLLWSAFILMLFATHKFTKV